MPYLTTTERDRDAARRHTTAGCEEVTGRREQEGRPSATTGGTGSGRPAARTPESSTRDESYAVIASAERRNRRASR